MVWPLQPDCLLYLQRVVELLSHSLSSWPFDLSQWPLASTSFAVGVLWMRVIEYFSASFSWFSFALRRCNFCFCDRVNVVGHHQGMEYFGSAVLMPALSSLLLVLADSPKIIGPSLSFCTTTSVVPILIMSFFVILLVAVDIYPLPDWSALRPSGPTILLGLCLVTRLSSAQSVLYWRCQPVKYRCLECPPRGVLWHPKRILWHAPHVTRGIWWWYVSIWIWHRWIWEWRCPCRYVRPQLDSMTFHFFRLVRWSNRSYLLFLLNGRARSLHWPVTWVGLLFYIFRQ
jgi:hypothetical protein